ncbi:MAG TPA: DUF4388 domain-containing protein [Kofleriaceae bacterium]|nr:DUF4388 domain-containing protein [Kofleriaceae bacterium]
MSKQSLLLVDGDTRSLRVLEVSLRKAGFMVTAALSVQDALDKLELNAPDLIISETTFPQGDGFELRRRVRATPEWSEIPFIFLTAEAAIENKIRGLELGVDDYLTKPIYIKEIVTRINILLQKRQRIRFEGRRDGRTRFAGRVQDMPVVDVIQTIEISRKSGVIQFVGERGRQAAIYFRDGRVIDAEAGALQGEDAVYRLLTWNEGEFEVVFRTVRRREVITMSSQALLMEGMRRLDEWSRLFEQLPPLTHRFEVDTIELAARLGDVPDDNNRILRLFDGKRTLLEVIDASDVGDLECLQAISRLYFEELLLDLDHGKTPRRDTGKSLPVSEVDGAPEGAAPARLGSGPVATEADELGDIEVPGQPVGAEPEIATQEAAARPKAASRDSGPAVARTQAAKPAAAAGASGTAEPPRAAAIAVDAAASAAAVAGPAGSAAPDGPGAARRVNAASAGKPTASIAERAEAASSAEAKSPPGPSSAAGSGRGERAVGSAAAVTGAERLAPDATAPESSGAGAGPEVASARGAELDRDIGPLMGGYRPSSLRLIDEAVAAAQAIEPSLFDDQVDESVRVPDVVAGQAATAERADAPEAHHGNGVAVTRPPPEGQAPASPEERSTAADIPMPPVTLLAADREESGLRMIGSLGRDRAEASGELAPLGQQRPLRSETARELVTILPRRITRELPALTHALAESLPTPTPTSPVLAARPATAPAIESPAPALPQPRITLPGTGVRAASRSRRLLRVVDGRGPGLGAVLLIGLAVVLAGAAVLLRLRRHATPSTPAHQSQRTGTLHDAMQSPPPPAGTWSAVSGATGRREGAASAASAASLHDGGSAQDGASARGGTSRDRTGASDRAGADATTPNERPRDGAGMQGSTAPGGSASTRPVLPTGDSQGNTASQGGASGGGGASRTGASEGGGATQRGGAAAREPNARGIAEHAGGDGRGAAGSGSAAGTPAPPGAAAPTRGEAADRNAEAKALYDKAHDAIDESNFPRALELAEASLRLRRTARTYLLRAQAEQRLDRVDDALASVDAAARLAPDYGMVWETRGRILWAAQRREEARAAFEKFLALEPDSPKAASVRRLMNEPR